MSMGASRSDERPIVVLIHGTFTKNVADIWCQPDGTFADDLKKEFSGGVEIRRFDWFSKQQRLDALKSLREQPGADLPLEDDKSVLAGQAMGPNSETERRASGIALYEVLLRMEGENLPSRCSQPRRFGHLARFMPVSRGCYRTKASAELVDLRHTLSKLCADAGFDLSRSCVESDVHRRGAHQLQYALRTTLEIR
jgi:hypothetical protein